MRGLSIERHPQLEFQTARLKLEEAKDGEKALSPEQTAWPTLKPAGTTLFLGITNSPHREWKQLLPPTTWPCLQALQISARSSLTMGTLSPHCSQVNLSGSHPDTSQLQQAPMPFPTRKQTPSSPDYLETREPFDGQRRAFGSLIGGSRGKQTEKSASHPNRNKSFSTNQTAVLHASMYLLGCGFEASQYCKALVG